MIAINSKINSFYQVKLLRVLQDGKIRRVGGTRELQINVRIIAATNRNLEDLIQKGWFREDLYYRLNVIPLFLPPLRARKGDIPLLTLTFLKRCAQRLQKATPSLSERALKKLLAYHWPGNVRELENVIERAVNMLSGSVVMDEHILFDSDFSWKPQAIPSSPIRSLKELVAEAERTALAQAIEKYSSVRKLALALGSSHTAILKKLKKYNLTLSRTR